MIIPIAMGIAFLIANIVCLVLFIIVLIKLFKNEGALKGILGLFFGIYTFIWGWIKHKQLGMTKVMATWSILTVASMVMIPVMGVSSALLVQSYIPNLKNEANVKLAKSKSVKKSKMPFLENKSTKIKAKSLEKKLVKNAADKNMDWYEKAMALWQDGKYENPNMAVKYWGHAINENQNTTKAYNNRGLAYFDLKQYQKAIKDFNQAIKLDPGYATAYNNRGNSYYELTQYQQALEDFNQSLQLEPNYSKAHFNRGLVYYQLEKSDLACFDFQQACVQGDCGGIKWAKENQVCQEADLMGYQY